jgi:hypothetical protein
MHPASSLPQKRSVDELPENQSRTCSCPATSGAVGDLLHSEPHSARAPS